MERTLVLLKPDAVKRRLIGEIVARFERKGLRVAAMKMLRFDRALVERHYAAHVGRPFYAKLEAFTMSGPVVAMVLEANEAVAVVRAMMGATRFPESVPGTIRGDFAFSTTENLVHGSDSAESAAREIPIYFAENEIH